MDKLVRGNVVGNGADRSDARVRGKRDGDRSARAFSQSRTVAKCGILMGGRPQDNVVAFRGKQDGARIGSL